MTNDDEKYIQADEIVGTYGEILADATPVFFGLPISLLPYSKNQIKDAIQKLLIKLEPDNREIIQSLVQSYLSLAQFVTNDELLILENGLAAVKKEKPSEEDYELMEQASFITSRIKADMENYMEELQILLGEKVRLS